MKIDVFGRLLFRAVHQRHQSFVFCDTSYSKSHTNGNFGLKQRKSNYYKFIADYRCPEVFIISQFGGNI